MAGRNMLKILYPSSKKDNLYDQLKDFVEIFNNSLGNNPSSSQVQEVANKQWDVCEMITDPAKHRECVKKAQSYDKEVEKIQQKEKVLGSADIEKFIQQKLNDAGHLFVNDVFSYTEAARGIYRKAFNDMSKILDSIPSRDYGNYTDLDKFEKLIKQYQDKAQELTEMSNVMKGGDSEKLKYYGVFYNTTPNGVMNMSVGSSANQPSGAKPTNIKTQEGLPVYLIDPKPLETGPMKKAIFGGKEFTYLGATGTFQVGNPDEFNWDDVKKRNVATGLSWGDFAEDSTGNRYFVTENGNLAPVDKDVFRELGGTDEKLYKMSSWEEQNNLPNLLTNPITPMRPQLKSALEEEIFGLYDLAKAREKAKFTSPSFWFPWVEPKVPVEPFVQQLTQLRMGVKRFLPPTQKESIQQRTHKIIRGEFK